MKILCFGDLHLGAGAGYGRTPGDRLNDQQQVLGRIGGIAVEHQVDVILNLGDTFEGPGITPEQLEVFASFVDACNTLGIPVVAITGNGKHDAAMRDTNAVDIFRHIPGITVSSTPQLIDVAGATIATLPWVHPGRLVAAHDGDVDRDDINVEAAGLLVATARGLRAQIPDGRPAILALHGSVSGASTPDGALTDFFREPVLDSLDLQALGFDAIVMGHIHAPQHFLGDGSACRIIFSNGDGHPTSTSGMFYVGSPLPLNFGEVDCAHGVWILDLAHCPQHPEHVNGGGEGASSVRCEFVPVESRPFVTIDLDFAAHPDDPGHDVTFDHAAFEEGTVLRVRYRATAAQQRRIDVAQMRSAYLEAGAHVVKIEPDIVREDRSRVEGVNEDLQPLEAYDLWASSQDVDPDLAARARARMADLLERVA